MPPRPGSSAQFIVVPLCVAPEQNACIASSAVVPPGVGGGGGAVGSPGAVGGTGVAAGLPGGVAATIGGPSMAVKLTPGVPSDDASVFLLSIRFPVSRMLGFMTFRMINDVKSSVSPPSADIIHFFASDCLPVFPADV